MDSQHEDGAPGGAPETGSGATPATNLAADAARRRFRVIEGGAGTAPEAPPAIHPSGQAAPGGADTPAPSAPKDIKAARPVPEDFGLTSADLRIPYAPGRVGALLAGIATVGMAGLQAYSGFVTSDPWILGLVVGLLYGGLIGGFAGLGLLVLVHWGDPVLGWLWPVYGRLRRYREALAAARAAEHETAD